MQTRSEQVCASGQDVESWPLLVRYHALKILIVLSYLLTSDLCYATGALSYIELGLMIPKSGGEYQYLKEAYGDLFAFLLAWTNIIVTSPSAFAIIAFGFAQYVTAPFYPGCNPPDAIVKCGAAFCICEF